ncbi:LCP family protein [Streptomyces sp. RFCAC02]|uniref:LCP family protein n=1 Tax=Streptomyces sp. RFCAC02 TaxID=2499143 RepID=UPI001F10BFE6|nr:LCP family protein [Streptomyces sp. RFCAC02]
MPDGGISSDDERTDGTDSGPDTGAETRVKRSAGGRGGHRGTRGARRSRKKPKSLRRRIVLWVSGSLAFLLVAGAGAAWFYIDYLNGRIEKAPLDLGNSDIAPPEPDEHGNTPLNILLIGSDSRDGEENQRLGGRADLAGDPVRADVQILLHVAADRSNATLISIPRDTQVPIPECTDPETDEVYPAQESASINTAMYYGGPGCVVATWKELTGAWIDHFIMVEFEGVVDMADAIGGVPVCVDANMQDPKTGLRLEEGDNILEGDDALQWLRTRYAFEDGSDVGRTKAQQMYLSNMVEELQGSASLTDPGQLMDLAEAAVDALTVDDSLGSVQALYSLGSDLRNIPNDRINMVTLETLPDPNNPEVTVVPDPEPMDALFAQVRADEAIDGEDDSSAGGEDSGEGDGSGEEETEEAPDPADIAVAVQNGTGADGLLPVEGRATDITEALHDLGFTAASTDTTAASLSETAVYYADVADQPAAESIADALGLPRSAVRNSSEHTGVVLVVGADWREGTAFPESSDEPADGSTAEDDSPAVESEDIISGDSEKCMHVNPLYTW